MLVGQGDVDVSALKAWVTKVATECGDDLWRVHGVLAVKGDAHKHVLQGVHKQLEVQRRPDSVWPEASETDASGGRAGARRCQVVLIGKGLATRRANLEASAHAALGFPLRVINVELQVSTIVSVVVHCYVVRCDANLFSFFSFSFFLLP